MSHNLQTNKRVSLDIMKRLLNIFTLYKIKMCHISLNMFLSHCSDEVSANKKA